MGFETRWVGDPVAFEIHEDEFRKWVKEDEEAREVRFARQGFDFPEYPGAHFANLITNAIDAGVLGPVSWNAEGPIELRVNGDDDSDGAGYYVMLANSDRATSTVQITDGWRDLKHVLRFAEEHNDYPAAIVRNALEEVCDAANVLLHRIGGSARDGRR